MREIKFRAWNKVENQMYTDAINNCKDSFKNILKHPQIYKIMQYTGLKDKNGVEIYEGDIVRCKGKKLKNNFEYDEVEHISIIEHWQSQFKNCLRLRNNKGKCIYNITQSTLNTIEAEIIGNIYKNSELI